MGATPTIGRSALPSSPYVLGGHKSAWGGRHNGALQSQRSRDGLLLASSDTPYTSSDFILQSEALEASADVVRLSKDRNFFFGPLNQAIRDGVNPLLVAAQMLTGVRPNDKILVVRASYDNRFLGCVRFTDMSCKQAELSYFFDPQNYRRYLGSQAVLRAVHWLVHEVKKPPRALVATVDPENIPSYKILKHAGLRVRENGFVIPDEVDEPYVDKKGSPRSRLVFGAKIPKDIVPSLAICRQMGRYSIETLVRA